MFIFIGNHKEVDELLMDTNLKPKLNSLKLSNTSVEDFKVILYFEYL